MSLIQPESAFRGGHFFQIFIICKDVIFVCNLTFTLKHPWILKITSITSEIYEKRYRMQMKWLRELRDMTWQKSSKIVIAGGTFYKCILMMMSPCRFIMFPKIRNNSGFIIDWLTLLKVKEPQTSRPTFHFKIQGRSQKLLP